MFNTKNTLTIFKKELKTYFNSPTAYIVLVVFLMLWEYLFFRNVFLVGEASVRILLTYIPWLFTFLIPAITMGSISGEKSDGTLEYLLTHPLNALELIFGKFFAALVFSAIALAFMFPIAYSLNMFGNVDWGVVAGQYFASLLLASVMISVGIFVSSLFSSQISALLVAAAINFFLIIAGFELVTLTLPNALAQLFERLSVLTHFESMSRGVLDLRDIWYFVSAVAIFLSLGFLQIIKIRLQNQKKIYKSYIFGIALFIGIAILVNIVGTNIPGRIDLTEDKAYQLTQTTIDTVENLEDVVNIKLFASNELPAQLRPILRDTKDILRDYQTFSGGKIIFTSADPSTDSQAKNEATNLGIREVQFNVIGQEELQLKKGYLGLAVVYGTETELLPLISDTSDLEYQITSFIKKLTTNDKKTIGFLTGHGEKTIDGIYTTFVTELEKVYEVQEVEIDGETPISPDIDTLVVAGPRSEVTDADRKLIDDYINSGGSAFFLIDSVNVNDITLNASLNGNSLSDFLQRFGVNIGVDIVYDLRSNETVNFGGDDGVNFIINYPFWPRSLAVDKSSPIVNNINTLVVPWPSSLELIPETIEEKGYEVKKLFNTTQFAGAQVGTFNIRPDQQILPEELEEKTLAVSLLAPEDENGNVSRIVVVTDSDLLANDFVGTSPENLAFGLDSVSWLSQEQSLAEIQLKQRLPRKLVFTQPSQQTLIRFGNLALAFLAPFVIGSARLIRRNNLKKYKYSSDL